MNTAQTHWHQPALRVKQVSCMQLGALKQSEATQVEGDAEGADERRAELRFGLVSGLRLSFRDLVHVDNLQGLTNLRTLQLDNNALTRLENLDHLVRRACGKPGCLWNTACQAAAAAHNGLLHVFMPPCP